MKKLLSFVLLCSLVFTAGCGADGEVNREIVLQSIETKYASTIRNLTDEVTILKLRLEESQEEYVIVDRNGRIQLPREMLNKLNLSDNKVTIEMIDDCILIKKPTEQEKK